MSNVKWVTIKNKYNGFTRTVGEPEFINMIDKADYVLTSLSDAGNDDVQIKTAGDLFGLFNSESTGNTTSITLYEEGGGGSGSADYLKINVAEHGATTISTVDASDAEAAHLTFDIQGDTIFMGDIADGTSTEVARIDASASSLLIASGKKMLLVFSRG